MVTKSAQDTRKFGEKFADNLRGTETLALTGDLGSGKTTFVQGIAAGFGIKKRIISPTFILLRQYEGQRLTLWHLDLYRLEQNIAWEIENIGIGEIWGKGKNVVAVEWAEKIKKLLPRNASWIRFENLGGDKRRIIVK